MYLSKKKKKTTWVRVAYLKTIQTWNTLWRSRRISCSIGSVHNWMEQKKLSLKNVFVQVQLLNEGEFVWNE